MKTKIALGCGSIVVLVVILTLLHWVLDESSTVIIENQTGKDISTLVVLWPNGKTERFTGKLRQNERVTMKCSVAGEGSVEIFFYFSDRSQWHHFHTGISLSNFRTQNLVIIDKSDFLVKPNNPHPNPLPKGEGTILVP